MTGRTGQLIAGAKAVARAAAGPQGAAGALSFSLLPSFFLQIPSFQNTDLVLVAMVVQVEMVVQVCWCQDAGMLVEPGE